MAGNVEASGSLLFPSGGRVLALDVQSREVSTVIEGNAGSPIGGIALAPDGEHLAVSVHRPSPAPGVLSGTDLYLASLSSGMLALLQPHGAPGIALSDPAWSADNQWVYYTKREPIFRDGRYVREDISIERISVDGGSAEKVLAGAMSPSLSADGELLAYIAPVGGLEPAQLWVSDTTGFDPRQVATGSLSQLGTPRFAPNGTDVAFTAVADPSSLSQGPTLNALSQLFLPQVVEAHGVPWDIWIAKVGEFNLQRLTDVGEDSPVPVWSSDGSYLAFSGEMGLYLFDRKTGVTSMLALQPAPSVTWRP